MVVDEMIVDEMAVDEMAVDETAGHQNFLHCLLCNRNLVKFLVNFFLKHIGVNLQPQQLL